MKVVNLTMLVVLLCLAVVASGCCSIMSGGTQKVPVSSTPPGAKITADDGTMVMTPGTLTLRRNQVHTLVAEYPGHEPQQQKLIKKLNNWIWLDPLIDFGIISIPIDFLTGSADELNPKEVHFNFSQVQKTEAMPTSN